ncbi:class I SAM-dependent methyltransferase [Flavobacterium selenitireducens]|uniref:class I SAM-dependent methyltransferase n=1 Tax=Flavobacterium selenitireducens TaxID=2722704 RepID=UPI00168A64F7|nr:class I SAM-dependent methyltransferase [Flavobacterium selenitireducens]MBD3580921.1 class I SAM-dependent methyltransferase [Flavobacterium selenitireducens]
MDVKILETDFSPRMIELAKSNVPNAEFRVLNAKEVLSLGEIFDGIVCGFIAPYLNQAELSKLIADCEKLLSDNGKLYLSAIEGDYENSGWQSSSDGQSSTMVYLYSEPELRAMLYQNGFRKIEVYKKAFGSATHLILAAAF